MRAKKRSPLKILGRLRRHREKAAELAFGRDQSRSDAVRNRIRQLEATLADHTMQLRRAVLAKDGTVSAEAHRLGIDVVRSAIEQARAELTDLERAADGTRRQLLGAMKDRQASDWLQSQAQEKTDQADRRMEAGELDDAHAAHTAGESTRGSHGTSQ